MSAPAIQGNGKTDLRVTGMTCANCARHVREALVSVPGVQSAEVQLEQGTASVRWNDGDSHDAAALLKSLDEAGYPATVDAGEAPANRWSPLSGWLFNVVAGTAVTLPLMFCEWVLGAGMERWYQWLSFILVLPIQVFGGARFYSGAWRQLKKGQSNMDTLVSLGSTTAFLYSLWGLFAGWHSHLYFMDAAAIITLVSVGHYLESKASAQAASSLKALLQLAPQTARRVRNGVEDDVPVASLGLDDVVSLKPGDRVPTDGVVTEGNSSVNESMLTGESLPVEKNADSKVYAGTLNESGHILYRVSATGEETALAHIIQIVQQAQSSRASIQRLGDKVSSIFVPIVVAIAIATALWWGLAPQSAEAVHRWLSQFLWAPHLPEGGLSGAIFHAAAVLIIACPCAMGLATPIAIMAGTNAAAKRGILIRDGASLEKSGRITCVLFDKTGTLTQGKISVAAVEEFAPNSQVQHLARSLAQRSNHPLSRAIAGLPGETIPLQNWNEIRGSGLQADREGQTVRLGSLRWLRENGIDLAAAQQAVERWSREGATLNGVAQGQTLLGLIALKDLAKPHAREVIERLERDGKRIYMVTGDNQGTAEAIARQVGITPQNIFAETRPEGKIAVIKDLQSRGERVAFVGDGINDAPALEQADLGIALMNASDVARESADIILLKADLEAIPESLGLAQATLRNIKQNLFWAFFYNAAGIPLAVVGFLSPIFSAFAMGMSDLVVIGNALRLRWWKR
ncbi:MAG: heavy metal translocating P-type ATPase [Verrucomicrobiota bacterium]